MAGTKIPKAPENGWNQLPKRSAQKFIVLVNSRMETMLLHPGVIPFIKDKANTVFSFTNNPKFSRQKPIVINLFGKAYLEVTLRMYGWVASLIDRAEDEKNEKFLESYGDRIDDILGNVAGCNGYTQDEIQWAWSNRAAQRNFQPPFKGLDGKASGEKQ